MLTENQLQEMIEKAERLAEEMRGLEEKWRSTLDEKLKQPPFYDPLQERDQLGRHIKGKEGQEAYSLAEKVDPSIWSITEGERLATQKRMQPFYDRHVKSQQFLQSAYEWLRSRDDEVKTLATQVQEKIDEANKHWKTIFSALKEISAQTQSVESRDITQHHIPRWEVTKEALLEERQNLQPPSGPPVRQLTPPPTIEEIHAAQEKYNALLSEKIHFDITPIPAEPKPGPEGELVVVKKLGQGMQGVVFEAEDKISKRHYAVKVPLPLVNPGPEHFRSLQHESAMYKKGQENGFCANFPQCFDFGEVTIPAEFNEENKKTLRGVKALRLELINGPSGSHLKELADLAEELKLINKFDRAHIAGHLFMDQIRGQQHVARSRIQLYDSHLNNMMVNTTTGQGVITNIGSSGTAWGVIIDAGMARKKFVEPSKEWERKQTSLMKAFPLSSEEHDYDLENIPGPWGQIKKFAYLALRDKSIEGNRPAFFGNYQTDAMQAAYNLATFMNLAFDMSSEFEFRPVRDMRIIHIDEPKNMHFVDGDIQRTLKTAAYAKDAHPDKPKGGMFLNFLMEVDEVYAQKLITNVLLSPELEQKLKEKKELKKNGQPPAAPFATKPVLKTTKLPLHATTFLPTKEDLQARLDEFNKTLKKLQTLKTRVQTMADDGPKWKSAAASLLKKLEEEAPSRKIPPNLEKGFFNPGPMYPFTAATIGTQWEKLEEVKQKLNDLDNLDALKEQYEALEKQSKGMEAQESFQPFRQALSDRQDYLETLQKLKEDPERQEQLKRELRKLEVLIYVVEDHLITDAIQYQKEKEIVGDAIDSLLSHEEIRPQSVSSNTEGNSSNLSVDTPLTLLKELNQYSSKLYLPGYGDQDTQQLNKDLNKVSRKIAKEIQECQEKLTGENFEEALTILSRGDKFGLDNTVEEQEWLAREQQRLEYWQNARIDERVQGAQKQWDIHMKKLFELGLKQETNQAVKKRLGDDAVDYEMKDFIRPPFRGAPDKEESSPSASDHLASKGPIFGDAFFRVGDRVVYHHESLDGKPVFTVASLEQLKRAGENEPAINKEIKYEENRTRADLLADIKKGDAYLRLDLRDAYIKKGKNVINVTWDKSLDGNNKNIKKNVSKIN